MDRPFSVSFWVFSSFKNVLAYQHILPLVLVFTNDNAIFQQYTFVKNTKCNEIQTNNPSK